MSRIGQQGRQGERREPMTCNAWLDISLLIYDEDEEEQWAGLPTIGCGLPEGHEGPHQAVVDLGDRCPKNCDHPFVHDDEVEEDEDPELEEAMSTAILNLPHHFASNIYPGAICGGPHGCGDTWEQHPEAVIIQAASLGELRLITGEEEA